MHLIALVESPEHVCCRYRIAAFRPLLEQAGHSLELQSLPRRWWSWFRLGHALGAADAVILQRKLLQGWQRLLLRRAARILVFDFDDAIFLRDSYAARGLHDVHRLRRFVGLVRAADAVIAGNAFLRNQAQRSTSGDKIHIIPTCLDPHRYLRAEHNRTGEGVRLVWVGSSSTLKGLEAIRPLLEEIGRQVPGLHLKLICDHFLRLENLQVHDCPWSEAREAVDIATADIGISHVPDDLWSRGKCGLKVLQYMAAGLPVVANPVGVQKELIEHGVNGFLADTPAAWVAAIRRLAGDPNLRRRMGQAGRQRVEKEWSITAGAARWVDVLNRLGSQRQAA